MMSGPVSVGFQYFKIHILDHNNKESRDMSLGIKLNNVVEASSQQR